MTTTDRPDRPDGSPHVVVAGGGFAALEAVLALREHRDERGLRITLLTPAERFRYPPLAVLAPFGAEADWSLPLATVAAELGATLRHGALAAVDVASRTARTTAGDELPYDALLVATGARADRSLEGAVPFRGAHDGARIRDLLDELAERRGGTLAFVAPTSGWALPLYELAMLAAADLRDRDVRDARVVVVTHARAPLSVFGAQASGIARARLARHGVELLTGVRPVAVGEGVLELEDGGTVPADAVVAMPSLAPRRIAGLPADGAGFLPIDRHARVLGAPSVYAAGDATAEPVKQGGLACQQADAAAEAILHDLGDPLTPAPYRPVLRAVLLDDEGLAYLRRPLTPPGGNRDLAPPPGPLVRRHAWPEGKVVGRRLSAWLSERGDGPPAPEAALEAVRHHHAGA